MGGSYYDHDYAANVSNTRSTKSTDQIFVHQQAYQRTGLIDDSVNPKGVKVREARDSDDHPNSNPIIVSFDVTGSMGHLPEMFAREKLPKLMSILLAKNVIEDPQICFVAQADAHGDSNPLQIGQFESDNRMDEWLTKFVLGGGGSPRRESYDLVLYWAATHTATDSFEKRGKKGYLFLVGDESYYPSVEKKIVKEVIGDDIEADIPIEEVVRMAQEKWNVIKICVETPSFPQGMLTDWQKLLGEQAVYLDDPKIVCEFIAAQIAAYEGLDHDTIQSALASTGASKHNIDKVTKALVPSSTGGGMVKKGSLTGQLQKSGGGGGNTRL